MKVHCPTCDADTLIGTNGCCSWCDTHLDETKPAPTLTLTKRQRTRKEKHHG